MININCDNFIAINKAINSYRIQGENIPVYLNKVDSYLTKDRVAASFISDAAFKEIGGVCSNLIRTIDNQDKTEVLFKSDKELSYNALIALIYELRLNGMVVTDIASISLEDGSRITFISDLHTDTNIIKVSVVDELRPLVKTIISEHEFRSNERHTAKIVKVKAVGDRVDINKLITIALKKSLKELVIFNVESNTDKYYTIYDSADITCVMQGNNLLFVSTAKKIKIGELESNISMLLAQDNRKFYIEATNEIIMF